MHFFLQKFLEVFLQLTVTVKEGCVILAETKGPHKWKDISRNILEKKKKNSASQVGRGISLRL